MKILHISTFDKGGAAKSAIRLHKGLLKKNINSRILVKSKETISIPEIYRISITAKNESIQKKIIRKIEFVANEFRIIKPRVDKYKIARLKGLELFSYPYSEFDITKSSLYEDSSLINLHWVADFVDYPSFFSRKKLPVVWTLHDQNPFSGGEHYHEQYYNIDENGYPLKRKFTNYEKLLFSKIENIKYNALKDAKDIVVVSPSKWLANEARNSKVFNGFDIKVIPYGIDSRVFKPIDKETAREILNLPKNKVILLFVADATYKQIKGFHLLNKALQKFTGNDDLVLIKVGRSGKSIENHKNVIELGFISDELLLSIVYSAADAFIIPSLMDNFPNTVLESIMCGTPVIGFPVGGIVDVVDNMNNGILADQVNSDSLAEAISYFLDKIQEFDNKIIRNSAVAKYDLSIQAEEYIKIYKSLIN